MGLLWDRQSPQVALSPEWGQQSSGTTALWPRHKSRLRMEPAELWNHSPRAQTQIQAEESSGMFRNKGRMLLAEQGKDGVQTPFCTWFKSVPAPQGLCIPQLPLLILSPSSSSAPPGSPHSPPSCKLDFISIKLLIIYNHWATIISFGS